MKLNHYLKTLLNIINSLIANVIIFLINVYKIIISPYFPHTCRFYPSCSTYMIEAIKKYKIIKGFYLGIKRISKCHPFNDGGYDPVP